MPTKPMADAITSLSQQFFTPPHPVAPGGPQLPERLPEDETNPFMLIMDAIRGATYGAEDSSAAKFGALMSAMAPVVGGPMAALKGARAATAAEGAGAEAVQGIKAYHGSAADFERFDPRRIGSGEGAASYGYGHYFAEEPKVAESYRTRLSGRAAHGSFDRYPIAAVPYIRGVVGDIAEGRLTAEQGAKAIYNANATMRNYPPAQLASELSDIAQTTKGRMYDVHIKADPAQFLSWDQPLSQQPEAGKHALEQVGALPSGYGEYEKVINAMNEIAARPALEHQTNPALLAEWDALNRKRNQLIARFGPHPLSQAIQRNTLQTEDLLRTAAKDPETARKLGEAGIPGIRYLDQGSRGAGEGTHNYVVFPGNEALIDILRKYGIPAALASALAKYAQQPQGEQVQ